ncbi:MAG: hypothetical protein GWN30_01800, partial [Gammaproteobacteria bacterium]|nr:hypothetical protein [Gammaproteobacteria bacterium]
MQYLFLLLFLLASQFSLASSSTGNIYEAHTLQSFEEFYPRLYASLED